MYKFGKNTKVKWKLNYELERYGKASSGTLHRTPHSSPADHQDCEHPTP